MLPDLSCSTAAWKLPLEDTLAAIASLGFTHVDLIGIGGWPHVDANALADRFEAEASRVEAALSRHHLKVSAFNCAAEPFPHRRSDPAGNARRLQVFDGLARLAARLGVRVAGFYPGWWIPAPYNPPWDEAFAAAVESFREIVATGAAHGITFAPEPHFATPFHDLATTQRLLEDLPDLPIVYDCTHFLHAGTPQEATYPLIRRAVHVHVRDVSRTAIHAPAGTGLLDPAGLAAALRAAGYTGAVTIEGLPAEGRDSSAEVMAIRNLFR